MKILVADKLAAFAQGRLQDLGAQVTVAPELKAETLVSKLSELDPEVLVVRSTRVPEDAIAAAGGLSLIIRAGAGVNTIDMDAASARGVYVANCPGKNAAAVAELAIGHLINLDRRIADNVQALREHRWDKKGFGGSLGLHGRTLAVLGCGTIGRAVITRAKALGMKVVAWSRSLDQEYADALGVRRAPTPEDAVRDAHAVSVHLALTKETKERIGESVFAAMREGAYFVNTSRGDVVDQDALIRATSAGRIRAGLDVFANEPKSGKGAFDDPIADDPNVYGTHHIGASTIEAEEAVAEEVVRIVAAYGRGQPVPNCVNLAELTEATHMVVVRHADQVGVLAHVLQALSAAGHNVEEMQNIVFSGGKSACARIAVVGAPSPATLSSIARGDAIYAVSTAAMEREA